jgi:hypothetical protein
MLYIEISAVYSEKRTKLTNAFCKQNLEFFNVTRHGNKCDLRFAYTKNFHMIFLYEKL